jgi:hypothetical protein
VIGLQKLPHEEKIDKYFYRFPSRNALLAELWLTKGLDKVLIEVRGKPAQSDHAFFQRSEL